MCHHWAGDRDAEWEQVSEDLPEEDPELQEPEREHDERVEAPTADDD
jgi:hypothetical protein